MKDVKWVNHRHLEGPMIPGEIRFTLPTEFDERDVWLKAVTVPEGGRYDAINMYDQGIVSFGLIQFIEANFYNLSHFLLEVREKNPVDFDMNMSVILAKHNANVVRTKRGPRFSIRGTAVETLSRQQKLFLGCDGRSTSWTEESRTQAIEWARSLSNLLSCPDVVDRQRRWVKNRLPEFFFKNSKMLLDLTNTDIVKATRALYVTFAVNSPGVADLIFENAVKETYYHSGSSDWCYHVIRELALTDKKRNFLGRYNKALPIVEKAFNVKFPQLSEPGSNPHVIQVPVITIEGDVNDEHE